MSHYVGLDVSLKEVSLCIVARDGAVVARATLLTEPDVIAEYLAQAAANAERVVHESGLLATWRTRAPERPDMFVTCIDARMDQKSLSARLNKSNKAEAEGLAQSAQTGWFTKVRIRSEASDRVRTTDSHTQGS